MATQNIQNIDPDGDIVLALNCDDDNEDNTAPLIEDTSPRSFPLLLHSNRRERVPEKHLRVSSRHLVLASRVFRRLLSGENKELPARGNLSHTIRRQHMPAFLLLIDVIHGRGKTIPSIIDLSMLTSVATLVEKYELHEATRFACESWVEKLRDSMPNKFAEDIVYWVFISWVFKRPVEFQKATLIAERGSAYRIDEQYVTNVIINKQIVDEIDQSRQDAISEIISIIKDTVNHYQSPMIHCKRDCDAMVLGSLVKAHQELSRLFPLNPPYYGLSVSTLVKSVQGLDFPTLCSILTLHDYNRNRIQHMDRRHWPGGACDNFSHNIYVTARNCANRPGGLFMDGAGGVIRTQFN